MDVRQAVRPDILRTYIMMPFQFDPEDSGTLYVAMNEPMNMNFSVFFPISRVLN